MGKKRTKSKKAVPQKGDPDFLSPTQLRNARKRRAKQQKSQQEGISAGDETVDGSRNDKPSTKNNATNKKDPSMKYITNPTNAPIVQAAKQYFKPILQDCNVSDFHVHVGPHYEWRTVSKLAVRPAASSSSTANSKPKVAIGLFLPQSHTLLPVPNCRAHHPSINHAVECITKACHEVGIVPYQEHGKAKAVAGDGGGVASDSKINIETGVGQLRYVAINVARDTGAAQITLVWNTPPPDAESNDGNEGEVEGSGSKRKYDGTIDDPVLEELVTKIISMSNKNINTIPSAIEDEKDGVATANDDSCKSTYDDQAPKKRRRRGRREGEAAVDTPSGNINSSITNKVTSHIANGTKRGKQPKLNLHSLWVNYNESWKHSNAIFSFDSSSWRNVHGPPSVTEHLTFNKDGGLLASPKPPSFSIPLSFPPNVFRQANIDAFTNIVGRIRERMQKLGDGKDDISCVELYGGVGTIGLHVSDVVSSLVSSDENPNNLKCFNDSVRALPANIQSRLSYKQKNAADMVMSEPALFQRSDVLIVDPPRKGLDAEVVDYLCQKGGAIKLIVYVSCGFQAFQRDCDALVQSGRWKVEFAEGYLLFPGADAIETMSFFVPA
mmetsp:Transcript_7505/g.17028  ORF Transcript_7505/g.17028 Transcript_7505/m.17028 type:complete len:609 (+) Transcript_7505:98-1924(+)